jgi:excisionase family DNA binding protein
VQASAKGGDIFMDNKELVLSVATVAKRLHISRNLAYQMCHEGKIPTIKFGKRILVPKVALDKLLSGN